MVIEGKGEDWVTQPRVPDIDTCRIALTHLKCPVCGQTMGIGKKWLVTKTGFSNLRCANCRKTISAKWWMCSCSIMWYKCKKHFLQRQIVRKKISKIPSKPNSARGVDKPLPKVRKSIVNAKELPGIRLRFLRPGTRLAALFPDAVIRD